MSRQRTLDCLSVTSCLLLLVFFPDRACHGAEGSLKKKEIADGDILDAELLRNQLTQATTSSRSEGLAILDATDKNTKSLKREMFDVKLNHDANVTYKVMGARSGQKVVVSQECLTVRYSKSDQEHREWYDAQDRKPGYPEDKEIVRLIQRGNPTPATGTNTFAMPWDGRDGTTAERIVLKGAFSLTMTASVRIGNAAEKLWRSEPMRLRGVTDPHAHAYAHKVPRGGQARVDPKSIDLRRWARDAVRRVRDLGFSAPRADDLFESKAQDCLDHLSNRLAAMFFIGHGGPGRIWFYPNQSDHKFDPEHYEQLIVSEAYRHTRKDEKTKVRVNPQNPALPLPADGKPLRDVFLVVLVACETANPSPDPPREAPPVDGTGLGQHLVHLGADIVIGFKYTLHSTEVLNFPKYLLQNLSKKDMSSGEAAETAAKDANVHKACEERHRKYKIDLDVCKLQNALVVDCREGINELVEKLRPARYGNSTD